MVWVTPSNYTKGEVAVRQFSNRSKLVSSVGSGDENVPSWKAEIQLRRRSKVFIPSQKPDQPIKLVETPQWKLDLAERTKNKKDSDTPKVC